MRKGYSLLLLLICFFGASAQNWAPINTTDKYNYKLDTASAISHTLWVDSVQVVGGDTVYYMNRIVKAISDSIALKNQPQFLQKQVVKALGGYTFNSPNSIGYSTTLAIGDSVIYDTINNISAKVIAADTATVLSNPDSIKALLLSSGDTIIVSKNYGFVQYPYAYGSHKYYRLAGIEGGRNVGDHVARFYDFFDFQVGDVFEYYQYHGVLPDQQGGGVVKTKMEIATKQVASDTIYYGLKINFTDTIEYVQWPIINYFILTDMASTVLHLVDSSASEINLYPNQIEQVTENNPHNGIYDFVNYFYQSGPFPPAFNEDIPYLFYPVSNYIGASSYKDNLGRTVKIFDTYYGQDTFRNHSDTLRYWKSTARNVRTFATHLGLTSYIASGFEEDGGGYLLAYRTSTDTMGVLDTFIKTGVSDIEPRAFTIQPNPITSTLNIQLPEATNSTIRLLDINGSEVFVQQSNDSHISINTSSLPAGLYIVEVRTKDGVGRKKVVKL